MANEKSQYGIPAGLSYVPVDQLQIQSQPMLYGGTGGTNGGVESLVNLYQFPTNLIAHHYLQAVLALSQYGQPQFQSQFQPQQQMSLQDYYNYKPPAYTPPPVTQTTMTPAKEVVPESIYYGNDGGGDGGGDGGDSGDDGGT